MDTPLPGRVFDRLRGYLSPQELGRADTMALPLQRERFIARRGLLRLVLAHHLHTRPQAVHLTYGPQGKPHLCQDRHAGATLHFNFTHSRDLAILAVTSDGEVGVDVEAIDTQRHIQGIGRRYFHPLEWQRIADLPADMQPQAFFDTWACKEAVVKAHGGGIMAGLGTFIIQGVDPQPGVRQALDAKRIPLPWSLQTLQVTDRLGHPFIAAVARRQADGDCQLTLTDTAMLLEG